MNSDLRNKTLKNLIYSFSAQLISIFLSVSMSLLIPKILGVSDFGYWQLFLFYINYVGFFHFGITDGMYLKTGGMDYDKVNKKELSSQFWILLILQLIILFLVIVFSVIFASDFIRRIILIATGIYMIIANANWYLGYIFQATNRVKLYSISVMIDKLLFLFFIIFAFAFKIKNLIIYIPIFIFTTLCALIFSIINTKDIIFSKTLNFRDSINVSLSSAKIGINLTLSSISSLLILGIGRFLVDKVWGIESFSKFSLALSLTNFFLLFIIQISIVLFPTLRKVEPEVAKRLYKKFNQYLDSFLPIIYVLYIPIKIVLGIWLPQYSESLTYLALLLPICIFDGKTQMINNTYFKVLREEKKLLKINIIILLISSILSIVAIYILEDINFVILGMLVSICIRSIIGEKYLVSKMEISSNFIQTIMLIIVSLAFIVSNLYLSDLLSFIFTIIVFIVYSVIFKSYIIFNEVIKKILIRN